MKNTRFSLGLLYKQLLQRRKKHKGEEGLALLLALMTGLTILAGASGLLIHQLKARKVGASASYQQMAEAAAINGFNRILSKLNSANKDRGYLYSLDNNEDDNFNWELINKTEAPLFEQICTDTSSPDNAAFMGLPIHKSNKEAAWPTGHVGAGNTEKVVSVPFIEDQSRTQRKDGKSSIQSYYRLKSYSTSLVSGTGEGIFEIEGIVKRVDAKGENYLARALLVRTFNVESKLTKDDDWGVIAAKHFDLGATSIVGDGKILWHVNEQDATGLLKSDRSGCIENLLSQIKGKSNTNNSLIWPVMNREKNIGLSLALFGDNTSEGENIDYDPNNSGIQRVWSFDDTKLRSFDDTKCGEGVGLTRAKNRSNEEALTIPKGFIITSESTGKSILKSCVGLTPYDQNNQKVKKFWSAQKACRPDSKFEDYGYVSVCFDSSKAGKQTLNDGYKGFYSKEAVSTNWKVWIPTPQKEWTVRIRQKDICLGQNKNECHIYIEHMNLENTKVFIENDGRPVVLHLELPNNDSKFMTGVSSGQIKLSKDSLLCGVNSGQTECNNKPESFVISQTNGKESSDCDETRLQSDTDVTELQSILSIDGNSLPAALVSLRTGTFTLSGDANMRGMVWASSFCSQGNMLSLNTNQADGKGSVVQAADELWDWSANGALKGPNPALLGKTITRGIRGSGLDLFRRW